MMTDTPTTATTAEESFDRLFGREPQAVAIAPGRVNLLGEHTDYNDGFVLPVAIPQHTRVQVARNGSQRFRLASAELGEVVAFDADHAPAQQFARYVHGCIRVLVDRGIAVPGLDLRITSDVPIGVGLSSSAALEVATLRALRALLGLDLDDVDIAMLAQRAEVDFAGVACGIMDQMASSLADRQSMLFLDTRTLERELLPLPAHSEILVLDSGIARTLAGSAYNERRRECEAAARALGVAALRDVDDPTVVGALPEPLNRRARHVVTENLRVLRARAGLEAPAFGALMNASHRSLAFDYEVSVPALDTLVALLEAQPQVHGARLTGAGFGGACVALCRIGTARDTATTVLQLYAERGGNGRMLVPQDGTPDTRVQR